VGVCKLVIIVVVIVEGLSVGSYCILMLGSALHVDDDSPGGTLDVEAC